MSDMNAKAKAFYGDKNSLPTQEIVLTNSGNKCPMCDTIFEPTQPLIPNVTMREFYGGRIKFFKDVECNCGGEYRLCIEQRYDARQSQNCLRVIDMIVKKRGFTKEELKQQAEQKVEELVEGKIHQEFEDGRIPTMKEREKIKKETVLATIVDLDTKIETLCFQTLMELQVMCKKEKIKYTTKDTKKDLAKKLLAKNPNLVSAD